MHDRFPVRIAIVGFGPKGLYALERLLDHAAALPPHTILEVDLFEPGSDPGAGPNYAPGQPAYLRMNYPAELIDLWWPESRAVPRSVQRSFVRWRADGEEDAYPPRSRVGEYLTDGFESLLRHAPRNVTVRLHQTAVDAVRAHDDAWEVSVAGQDVGSYDEVLIATGHQQTSSTALAADWHHRAPLVERVFPVDRWLTRDAVPAGARVGIRGFGLTFIDAALALTEGRGGSFDPLDHPYRLRYTPAADAVGPIVPFSRTGRVMLAKPGPGLAVDVPELETIAAPAREALLALEAPVSLVDELLPILAAYGRGQPGRGGARAGSGSRRVVGGRRSGRTGSLGADCHGGARAVPRDRRRASRRPTCCGRSGTPGARSIPHSSRGWPMAACARPTGPPSTGSPPSWSGSRSARRPSTRRSCSRSPRPGPSTSRRSREAGFSMGPGGPRSSRAPSSGPSMSWSMPCCPGPACCPATIACWTG